MAAVSEMASAVYAILSDESLDSDQKKALVEKEFEKNFDLSRLSARTVEPFAVYLTIDQLIELVDQFETFLHHALLLRVATYQGPELEIDRIEMEVA